MNQDTMNLAKIIKELRTFRNLTQAQLARKAKVSKNFIRAFERHQHDIDISTVDKLAQALKIPTSFVFILAEKSKGKTAEEKFLLELQKIIPILLKRK